MGGRNPCYTMHFLEMPSISHLAFNTVMTNFLTNPIALRKAKIVYNFGLSECNRVKGAFRITGPNHVYHKVNWPGLRVRNA